MKRILTAAVLLCILAVCGTAGLADSERENTLDLYLPSDPEQYIWEYTLENEDLVRVESETVPDGHTLGLPGRGEYEWMRIQGLESGSTVMKCLRINIMTEKTECTLVYRLEVEEDLQVVLRAFEMLEPETAPWGAVTSFFFTFGGYEPYRSYEMRQMEDGSLMTAKNDEEGPADQEMPVLLAELAEAYGVAGWDGFDGAAEGVLDGEGFLLTITWENGFSIHASGENAFPARYGDFRDAVRELFGE